MKKKTDTTIWGLGFKVVSEGMKSKIRVKWQVITMLENQIRQCNGSLAFIGGIQGYVYI